MDKKREFKDCRWAETWETHIDPSVWHFALYTSVISSLQYFELELLFTVSVFRCRELNSRHKSWLRSHPGSYSSLEFDTGSCSAVSESLSEAMTAGISLFVVVQVPDNAYFQKCNGRLSRMSAFCGASPAGRIHTAARLEPSVCSWETTRKA